MLITSFSFNIPIGIRSDSDMFTLGYDFKPWTHETSTAADGKLILDYIKETATENDFYKKIQFNSKVIEANFSTTDSVWTLSVQNPVDSTVSKVKCTFLHMCSGYYNYDHGYEPKFAGQEDFKGIIVHPQNWPKSLDYTNKKIVVIGSGATAITLIPSLAEKASHVIMLQRSPTFIVSVPKNSILAEFLNKYLPVSLAWIVIRWVTITFGVVFYFLCRTFKSLAKWFLISEVKNYLKDKFNKKNFTPNYYPWVIIINC